MRINVYSQELTPEVIEIQKESNTGRVYSAAQLILHSSDRLHHPPEDDDRSAVTFWLPSSVHRRHSIALAFMKIAAIFRKSDEPNEPNYIESVTTDLLEGLGASEDHECFIHSLTVMGLTEGTARVVHARMMGIKKEGQS